MAISVFAVRRDRGRVRHVWSVLVAAFAVPYRDAAAVGLASINSIANLGGFIGPFGFGALKSATGTNNWGLAAVAITLVAAASLLLGLRFVREAEAAARKLVNNSVKVK